MEVVLTTRQETILSAIVTEYVENGMSVSSSKIVSKCMLSMSSATVRNECQYLIELGFITKQHRSSGNIPTFDGLKYHVEIVLPKKRISNQAKRDIRSLLITDFADAYDIFVEMGELLSFLAKQLGVIVISHPEVLRLFRIEAIPLATNAVRLVLVFDNGQTRTFVFRLEESQNNERLLLMISLLNERLNGLTLSEINNTINERLVDIRGMKDKFIEMIIDKASDIFAIPDDDEKIFVGKKYLNQLPEKSSSKEFLEIALSGSKLIRHAVEDINPTKKISLHLDEKGGLCLVSARFSSIDGPGIVGFVGQNRLPYQKIVPLIEFAASQLSVYFLNEGNNDE